MTILEVDSNCPKCKKHFSANLAERTDETYSLEILKTVCFIMLKELQTNNTVTVLVKDKYLQNAKQLITLFKPLGIIVKSEV